MPSIAETNAVRSLSSPSRAGTDCRRPLEGAEEQPASWKENLDSPAIVLDLPTDRPRPAVPSYREAQRNFELNGKLTLALRELSRREGVTLFETLLAAFQVLLGRYSRQEDILVGVPAGERGCVTAPSLEALTQPRSPEGHSGSFCNALPVRTHLSDNPTYRELLGRVARAAHGAFAHHQGPHFRLADAVQAESSTDRGPLFQVLFSLQDGRSAPWKSGGAAINPMIGDNGKTGFDLGLSLVDAQVELHGTLEYNSDLFEAATIERLLGHFQVLLAGIVADPEQRISALPLLTEGERQQLLVEWNATEADFPSDIGVHELFEAQVEKTPVAVAAIFADQQLSYAELNARANQLAAYLRQLGVGPETLVGLAVERSLELVVGILGVLKAGGAYVPLDPAYPKERLAFLVQDSQIPILLTQKRLVPELPAHQARVVCLDADWEVISCQSTANPVHTVSGENLAYVIYTSGSTGKPKGILVHHRGLVNYLTWCVRAYAVEAGTGAPVCSSISFDLTITSLFSPLLAGRAVEIFPPCRDVELLREAFRTARNYSLVKITPAHLELLSKQISPEEARGRTQAFIIGGENLTTRQIAFWQQHAPDTLLVNEYGPTETVVGCCIYRVPRCAMNPDASAKAQPILAGVSGSMTKSGSIPIGRPIANTQLYVLDAHLQPVPVGVPGELYIGGAGLARGYLNRPELTAERFIPHPFRTDPGARLYRTGDLVRWLRDGNLEFLGRVDHQIKLRGFRIEPGEIEAALTQHPFVREAVVIVREDRPGNKRLVAYVVPRSSEPGCPSAPTSAPADLRRFLEQKLPPYMVPSAFVVLPRLPLTPHSKVDRRALPAPEMGRAELANAYAAPRTPLEKALAAIWKEVLGTRNIGLHDDFFYLGGDSLLAISLLTQIEKDFKKTIPLAQFFEGPTIERLAAALRSTDRRPCGEAPSALVEIQSGSAKPPLFLVHSLGGQVINYRQLARCLGPDQPVYAFHQLRPCCEVYKPQASVEVMAASYLEELLAIQSEEPFFLAGHSFGGIIAFEMAQQLLSKGHRVAFLGLMDTYLHRRIPWSASRLWGFLQNFPRWLRYEFFPRPPRQHLALFMRLVRRFKRKTAKLVSHPAAKSRDEEVAEQFTVFRLPDHIRPFCEANFRAFLDYRPQTYRGPATLFRASAQPLIGQHDPDLGWRKIIAGGLTIRIIPGTHDHILREPHVKRLAEEFRTALRR